MPIASGVIRASRRCALFGRAARENRIETLHAEAESLSERFATLSFDVQKKAAPEPSPAAALSAAASGGCFRGRSGRREIRKPNSGRRGSWSVR
ncbi:hypothetical protein LN650_21425 [Klebsiella pneumoniae subsp. pneumoniae]|nr:hypothetical protein [Klebsiella pneumoniae subsp. pneumoniae]